MKRQFLNIRHLSIRNILVCVLVALILPFNIALFTITYRLSDAFVDSIISSDQNLLSLNEIKLADEMRQIETFITEGFSSNTSLKTASSTRRPITVSINLQSWLSEFNARMLNLQFKPYAFVYDTRTGRLTQSYTNPLPLGCVRDLQRHFGSNKLSESPDSKWQILTIGGYRYLYVSFSYRGLILSSLLPIKDIIDIAKASFPYRSIYLYVGEQQQIPSIVPSRKLLSLELNDSDIAIWMTVDYTEIQKQIPNVQNVLVFLSCLSIFIIPLFYYIIQKLIIHPLSHIDRALTAADRGNIKHRIQSHNYAKEFIHINSSFNNMMDSLINLKIENYENEIKIQQHELLNLQLQIKPHFLYNTLNSISALASLNDYRSIQKIAFEMSDYFRYSMGTGSHLVALKKELAFLRSYLGIMEVRYSGCFTFEAHLDPGMEKLTIPPLLIHTFIENIMVHTVKVGTYTTITLSVVQLGKDVRIIIADDGEGISTEILEQIRSRCKLTDEFGKEHIGIWNCYKRLEIFYGKQAHLQIDSHVSEGTTVTIQLPYSEEETDVHSLTPHSHVRKETLYERTDY